MYRGNQQSKFTHSWRLITETQSGEPTEQKQIWSVWADINDLVEFINNKRQNDSSTEYLIKVMADTGQKMTKVCFCIIPFTNVVVTGDFKLLNEVYGIMEATCKYPCIYCTAPAQDIVLGTLRTIGTLKYHHNNTPRLDITTKLLHITSKYYFTYQGPTQFNLH